MSYDLNLAVERAIARLRRIAHARRGVGDMGIADALTEIAVSMEAPLADIQRARACEDARQQDVPAWLRQLQNEQDAHEQT